MSRRTFILLVASAAVLAFGIVAALITLKVRTLTASSPASVPGQIRVSGDVSIGGPFTLTDHDGRRVTEKDFAGRFMLIYFGYTFCPDVCPTELNTMALALDRLGTRVRVVPVFITIDPKRDTPEALKTYLASFGPDFVGLTGSDADIAAVAKEYRVYYKQSEGSDPGSYLMDHTSLLYLMGPDGRLAALFRTGATPEDIANGIKAAFSKAGPAASG
jgi:cytochrome oxidase Cu insertion factor (SCO1/SenC/PrrC family)